MTAPSSPNIDPQKLRAALKRTFELKKEAEAELEHARQELEAKTLRIQMLEPMLTETMTEKESLSKTLTLERQKSLEYEKKIAELKEQFAGVREEGSNREEVANLRAQLQENQAQIDVLNDTIEGLDKEVETLRSENQSFKKTMKSPKQQNEAVIDDLLQQEEAKRKKQDEANPEKEASGMVLSLNGELSAKVKEIEKYQRVMDEIAKQKTKLVEETKELRQSVVTLKSDVSARLRKEIAAIQEVKRDFHERDLEYKTVYGRSREEASKVAALEQKVTKSQESIREVTAANVALKSQMESLQRQLEEEKAKSNAEQKRLLDQLDAAQQLQNESKRLEREMKDAACKHASELAEAKSRLAAANVLVEEKTANEQELTQKVELAKNELRNLHLKLEDQSRQYREEIENERKKQQNIEEQYETKIHSYEQQLEKMSLTLAANEMLSQKITLLQQSLVEKDDDIAMLKSELAEKEKLKTVMNEKDEQIEILQEQIKMLKAQCEQLATTVEKTSTGLKESESRLKLANEQLDTQNTQTVNLNYLRKTFLSFCGMSRKDKDRLIPVILQILNCDSSEVEHGLKQWKTSQGFSLFM